MKMLTIFLVALLLIGLAFAQPQQQSQTLDNLQKAYQAEANAARRYELFASKAAEENHEQVAKLFRAVSQSETVHMQNHRQAIEAMGGTPAEIAYEEVEVETTHDNLEEPIEGEKQETESLYPEFVKIAKQEKAAQAEKSFTYAMQAEAQHEKLFKDALKHLGQNKAKDYYVSSVTGSTIAIDPGEQAPKPEHEGEEFRKIE
ncbi:rubrerythrin family protein [Pontibacter mangrovi]|uniref:Rubrerythrin family protein n=1 Tax=Pontibacter mangrovi TaxID=2589816 RepID=A0A501W426_9BACT|nr:rubrerythrin family protein [Pontibacter mangrovi]TPE43385.1 rubrerythrin family protein [Pontibacter mangrovi]